MTRFSVLILIALAFLVVPLSCSTTDEGSGGNDGDVDGDADGDADGDGDGDSDEGGGSGDGDTDTDIDTDADGDGDADTGGGSGDGDTDADADGDADGDGDGDGDVDTGVPQDTGFDTAVWVGTDNDAYRDTATASVGYDAGPPDASPPDAGYDAGTCADWDITIRLNPSRVMLLQDISSSMREGEPMKWIQARSALINLLATYGFSDMLHFGLDVFPDRRDCFANEPLVIDSAPRNGQNIFDLITLIELSQSTPLFMAMGNFLDPSYAPIFSSKEYPSYLIIISDGKDTCGNETNHFPDEALGANAAQLATRARTLRDDEDIYTIAIGFGDAADPEQLDAIASNGGTDYDRHIKARDKDELEAVFDDLAKYTINCEFTITPERNSDANTFEINWEEVDFFLNDVPISKDPSCAAGSGWDWVDPGTYSTVVFCSQLCEQIRNSERTDVSAEFECINTVVPI